ncbi:MAG: phage tail protein, partial [Alphaproteobacteria bacterium]|nr:phage tail protein [Alphaproteobacteria bacterium]
MASIVLSSIGSMIGGEIASGIGGKLLGSIGKSLGGSLDKDLGLSSSTSRDGPRLENLKVQDSRYGGGIPVTFGQVRVAGNFIWASDLIETSHEDSSSGKGGTVSGITSSTRTTYSYSIHCAIAIASGEIGGIETIWADSKVIYQDGQWKSGIVGSATIYNGTMTQSVDPLLQSYIGSGLVPAYHGTAYVVIESLQLGNFGNRLPNITFETIPAGAEISPVWLGSLASDISCIQHTVSSRSMAPLVIEGSSTKVRRVITGGFNYPNVTSFFRVAEYDVTDDVPVEIAQAQSLSFPAVDILDGSWSMSPDGRFVVFYVYDSQGDYKTHMAIYDNQLRQFGNILSTNFTPGDNCRQVAWIDAQRFVATERSDGKRGVRVFARAGMDIVELGFFDVWGAGTATTRLPLFYSQFTPVSGGLLYYTADSQSYFTTLYARPIFWRNDAVVAGEPYVITDSHVPGTGSGSYTCLLNTAEGEWTLIFVTLPYMNLISFRPGTSSVVITRPWQTITNVGFPYSACDAPVLFGDRLAVVQKSISSTRYRLAEILLKDGSFSFSAGSFISGALAGASYFCATRLDGARFLLLDMREVQDYLRLAIIKRRKVGDTLDNVVANLLMRAGYAESEYDVSALADVPLDGYVLDDQMSAAAALAPLQVYEPFDLVESDAVLKAVKRSNSSVVSIPYSEARAVPEEGSKIPPVIERSRAQELDLPVEVVVDYLDASRDYEVGSQRARRQATRGARSKEKVSLPIVCTAAKAKQIAEKGLFTAWAERESVKICWSRKWLALDPGDVVDLGNGLMRVMSINLNKGVLEAKGVLVPASAVTSSASADGGLKTAYCSQDIVSSHLYLMDMPLIRTEDDQPGVYVAVSGNPGWPGGSLWRSADGVSYSSIAGFGSPAVSGIATTLLPDQSSCYMDCASVVGVQLMQGSLSSCSSVELMNGANVAVLGCEIIQFKTAVLKAPGFYEISNLLRGRRGTEGETSSHAVGERFVVLTQGTVQFLPALLTDRNRLCFFRALSNGQELGGAWDVEFTYGLKTLQPLAPAHLEGRRASGVGSDLTVSWKRRARKNGDWIDNVDVPLDEPVELYDVEIMNGDAVVRT